MKFKGAWGQKRVERLLVGPNSDKLREDLRLIRLFALGAYFFVPFAHVILFQAFITGRGPLEERLSLAIGFAEICLLIGLFFIYGIDLTNFRSRNHDLPIRPYGGILLKITRFLLPLSTLERLVQEPIVDMWEQQQEALAMNEIWRYRWIGVRDQFRIILALLLEPISRLLFKFISPFIYK